MKALRTLIAFAALALMSTQAFAQTAIKPDGTQTALQADASGNLKVAPAAPTGTSSTTVQGTSAANAADDGSNPVKMACVEASATNANTAGQRSNVICKGGAQIVTLTAQPYVNSPADNTAQAGCMSNPGNFGLCFPLLVTPAVWNGTANVQQRGDSNVTYVGPGGGGWAYSSGTTGILSNTTTAVTMKAASGASVRNFIDSCQISTTAFGAAVPLAIRDGAGGSVLFAVTVPTSGFTQPFTVVFQTPLKGTANTLLEVVTTTANTSGSAMVNCQGHTGS